MNPFFTREHNMAVEMCPRIGYITSYARVRLREHTINNLKASGQRWVIKWKLVRLFTTADKWVYRNTLIFLEECDWSRHFKLFSLTSWTNNLVKWIILCHIERGSSQWMGVDPLSPQSLCCMGVMFVIFLVIDRWAAATFPGGKKIKPTCENSFNSSTSINILLCALASNCQRCAFCTKRGQILA